ncbi:MAG: hypothetical protein JXA57_11500 [Armatimonadetes bacterium]|nr:hypothetical protein [Armatimonadota bacterium]
MIANYDNLGRIVRDYLACQDMASLYYRVLGRWEEDYDGERTGLVCRTLTLLWSSRKGLSEGELYDLLTMTGEGQAPSDPAWSKLLLALRSVVVEHAGVLRLPREELKQAIRQRYQFDTAELHSSIADYFRRDPISSRSIDELPWQLEQAGDWAGLAAILATPEFLTAASEVHLAEVRGFWTSLNVNLPEAIDRICSAVEIEPLAHARMSATVAHLLRETGYYARAEAILRRLAIDAELHGDRAGAVVHLGEICWCLRQCGRLEDALSTLTRLERHLRDEDDLPTLAANLGDQAVVCADLGRHEQATALYECEHEIRQRLGDWRGLARSRFNQASILIETGDLVGAGERIEDFISICSRHNDDLSLAAGLGARAILERKRGRPTSAQKLHAEEERIYRRFGDRNGLQASLIQQASLAMARQDYDRAAELLKEQEELAEALGRPAAVVASLESWAVLNSILERKSTARSNAVEGLALATKHGLTRQQRNLQRLLDEFASNGR